MDDATLHAPIDQEANKKVMPTAALAQLRAFNLINCTPCDSNPLYATQTHAAGALS
jgi:hypothetical protein